MAAKMMKEKYGSSIGILDMHTIKPLDSQSIIRVAEKTGNIVTVEDHSINGGLGGAVAEVLCEAGYKGSFKRVGMPDELAVQMPILRSALEAMKVPCLELSGWEADDIIGTVSVKCAAAQLNSVMTPAGYAMISAASLPLSTSARNASPRSV